MKRSMLGKAATSASGFSVPNPVTRQRAATRKIKTSGNATAKMTDFALIWRVRGRSCTRAGLRCSVLNTTAMIVGMSIVRLLKMIPGQGSYSLMLLPAAWASIMDVHVTAKTVITYPMMYAVGT